MPQQDWFEPPPAPPSSGDPYLDELRERTRTEITAAAMRGGNAVEIARANALARVHPGIAPDTVQRNLPAFEARERARNIGSLVDRYPAIGKWAAANPQIASSAADDHESLGLLGSVWDTVKKLPQTGRSFGYGLSVLGAKANYAFADAFHAIEYLPHALATTLVNAAGMDGGDPDKEWDASRAYWQRGVDSAVAAQNAVRPKYTGPIQQGFLSGIENLPMSLAAVGAGALTRNPSVTLGMMGAQTGIPAYTDARIAGKSVPDALRYGIEQGGVEALTEKIPASDLLTAITKRSPLGKTLLTQLATEIPGEQVATFLQDLSEWSNLSPGKPYSEFVAERPSAAAQTLLATISGTSVQTGIAVAAQRAPRAAAHIADRIVQARRARAEQQIITSAAKAAEQSKLRGHDVVGYGVLVQSLADDAGVSHVYISGAAMGAYSQSDCFEVCA